MTTLRFLQIDVFSKTPGLGNPVAVFLDPSGSYPEMQRIANWTNLSETVFLTPWEGGYELRIFTPHEELPFAGHPTIGSAHAALHWGLVSPGDFVQRCGRGDIPLSGSLEDGVWAKVTRPTELPLEELSTDELAKALGTPEVVSPRLLDVGPRWLVARVPDVDALHAMTPDFTGLAALESRHPPTTGTTIYALDADGTPHVRSFAPLHGIPEDPVCGSGNLCAGEHMRLEGERSPGDAWIARQGRALGRDGYVRVALEERGVRLGGHAQLVLEGVAHL